MCCRVIYIALAGCLRRGRWLLGLLVLQSTSSFVLDLYKVRQGKRAPVRGEGP